MNNLSRLLPLLLIAVLVSITFIYSIFNLPELIIGAVVGLGALRIASWLGAVRPKAGPSVEFNPKEWPQYIAIILIELTGYYFYGKLSHSHLEPTATEYIVGMSYVVAVVVLPAIIQMFLLISNRSDKIVLTPSHLEWHDNRDKGSIRRDEIASISAVSATSFLVIPRNTFQIMLKNGNSESIPAYRMNFTWRDIQTTASFLNKELRV